MTNQIVMTFAQFDSKAKAIEKKCFKLHHRSLTYGSIANLLNSAVLEVCEKTVLVDAERLRSISQEVLDSCVQNDKKGEQ